MSGKITDYLETNNTLDVSDSTLWETFKVVMRGYIISYEGFLKKSRERRLKDVDLELSSLETLYRNTNNPQTLQNILSLKYEYNTLMHG